MRGRRRDGEEAGPRRILHVLDGLGGGGSEEWVRDIVAHLGREGLVFAVCSLLPGHGGYDYGAELRDLGARVRYVGLQDQWLSALAPRRPPTRLALRLIRAPYYRWVRPWLQHLLIFARLLSEIRRFQPHVVHCHLFYAFVHGVLAARLAGVPRVVCTVPALRRQMEEQYGWMFGAYRRLGRWVDWFVTGTSIDELEEVGIPRERISLLRGSVDFRSLRCVPREQNPVRTALGLTDAFPIILLTGRFSGQKGQAIGVQAAAALLQDFPRMRLLLLGEGREMAAVRALVAAGGLGETVLFPGFRTDLPHFYQLADLYWRTSMLEGMNRAAFLAMAYGLPIVAFDTRQPTEVLVDGETALLVPAGDARALAAASRRLLEAPEFARALGSAAEACCRQEWDIGRAIRMMAELYQGGRESPPASARATADA